MTNTHITPTVYLDENAPPPDATSARRRYPFHQLTQNGHCLVFPANTDLRKLSRAAHQYAARHDFFTAVRRQPDGTIRVWRIE